MNKEHAENPEVQPSVKPGQQIEPGKWYGGPSYYSLLGRRKRYKERLQRFADRSTQVRVPRPTWCSSLLEAVFGICNPAKMFADTGRAIRALTRKPVTPAVLVKFYPFAHVLAGTGRVDPERLVAGTLLGDGRWTCVCDEDGAADETFYLVSPNVTVAYDDTTFSEFLCCPRCATCLRGTVPIDTRSEESSFSPSSSPSSSSGDESGEDEEGEGDDEAQDGDIEEEEEEEGDDAGGFSSNTEEDVLYSGVSGGHHLDMRAETKVKKTKEKEKKISPWRQQGPRHDYHSGDRATWALRGDVMKRKDAAPPTQGDGDDGGEQDIYSSILSVLVQDREPAVPLALPSASSGPASFGSSVSSGSSSSGSSVSSPHSVDGDAPAAIAAGSHVPHQLERWKAVMEAVRHFCTRPGRQFVVSKVVKRAREAMPEDAGLYRPRTLEGYARRSILDFAKYNPGLISRGLGRQFRFVASERCASVLEGLLQLSERELSRRFYGSRNCVLRGEVVAQNMVKHEETKQKRKRKRSLTRKRQRTERANVYASAFDNIPLFGSYIPQNLIEWRCSMQVLMNILEMRPDFANADVYAEYRRFYQVELDQAFQCRMRRRIGAICVYSPHLLKKKARVTGAQGSVQLYTARPELCTILASLCEKSDEEISLFFKAGRRSK